eukprot:scaffold2281_cov125-Isochrysis_galbana.AAC.4
MGAANTSHVAKERPGDSGKSAVIPPASTIFGPVPVRVAMPPTFAAHATPSISPFPSDRSTACDAPPPRRAERSAPSPSLLKLPVGACPPSQAGAAPAASPPWAACIVDAPLPPPSGLAMSLRRLGVPIRRMRTLWWVTSWRSGAWLGRYESLADDSREERTASAIGIII